MLTNRERCVVQLIAEGHTNKQVASILSISLKTVETHRSAIMRKLNLSSSAGLVALCDPQQYRAGLIGRAARWHATFVRRSGADRPRHPGST